MWKMEFVAHVMKKNRNLEYQGNNIQDFSFNHGVRAGRGNCWLSTKPQSQEKVVKVKADTSVFMMSSFISVTFSQNDLKNNHQRRIFSLQSFSGTEKELLIFKTVN